ncbi:MAG: prepilin-type N-terminal cleavage/methylation domain-containing protein [Oceanipulchritudo sp.]
MVGGMRGQRERRGFTLLELLPGLALLLALMTVVGSLGVMTGESLRRGREKVELVQALEYAWEAWAEGEGRAALAVRTGGRWRLSVFPDRSWLPGPAAVALREPAYPLCRRRVRKESGTYWEVGRCGGDGEAFAEGMILMRIRIAAGNEEPERGAAQ